jgi:desulfoferrodoxin (superoxide reductase-like protein)
MRSPVFWIRAAFSKEGALKNGGKMRLLLSFLFILTLAVPAFSNPPQDITLKISGSQLEIFALHPSQNVSKHFVKSIKVYLNAKEISSLEFTSQDPEGQKADLSVPGLKKGDKLKVLAACSVYGDLEKEFPVP